MYCRNCGQQITNDSRYCSHCGELQKLTQTHANTKQVVSPKTVDKLEGIFGINISKQTVGYYLVWFLLHLIFLVVNWNGSDYSDEKFWPLSKRSEFEHYDFGEFLLYTLVPLFILVIYNLFKGPKEINSEAFQSKYDLTYENDSTPTVYGVWILIFTLIIYYINGDSESSNNGLTKAILSVFSLIIRIAITGWVVAIAKKLNRDTTLWGLFAFFLPSISLIIIGQKRKLKSK